MRKLYKIEFYKRRNQSDRIYCSIRDEIHDIQLYVPDPEENPIGRLIPYNVSYNDIETIQYLSGPKYLNKRKTIIHFKNSEKWFCIGDHFHDINDYLNYKNRRHYDLEERVAKLEAWKSSLLKKKKPSFF